MFLTSLKLLNFKNYRQAAFEFNKKFVLINGPNGSGKTNLIDAVYYLCLCRSYFTRSDNLSPRHGENFFRLDGDFTNGEKFTVTCKFQNAKKEFFLDQVVYEKLSDHIGRIPVVMVAPDDIGIINDGSEERRRFLDAAISQYDHTYLRALIIYNRVLQQRNAALKRFFDERRIDEALLGVLNHQLSAAGDEIHRSRKTYINRFVEIFNKYYLLISGQKEVPEIKYDSQLHVSGLLHLLLHNVKVDLEAERTTFGPHKDDLVFSLDGFLLKETGSQGQIKSFLIALKLAQSEMIRNATGKLPVLLLDDIFEKLDKTRLHVLFSMLTSEGFGQIFITDADEERSSGFFEEAYIDYDHLTIDQQQFN